MKQDRPLNNTSLFLIMQLIFKLAFIKVELEGNYLLTYVLIKQHCGEKKAII